MQRRILFRATGVAADQMQRRHRHIQFGVVGVGEHQVFTGDAAGFQRGHPGIATHAVLKMHDGLPRMQLREVSDQCIRVNRAAGILAATCHTFTKEIAFANQCQVAFGINETMFCRTNHQITTAVGGFIKA